MWRCGHEQIVGVCLNYAFDVLRRVAPCARILMYTSHAPVKRSLAVERGADDFCRKGEPLKAVVERVLALAHR